MTGPRKPLSRKPLHNIPAERFPLRLERYNAIHNELIAAGRGFAELGHDDLAQKIDEVTGALWVAWDAIVAREQRERDQIRQARPVYVEVGPPPPGPSVDPLPEHPADVLPDPAETKETSR